SFSDIGYRRRNSQRGSGSTRMHSRTMELRPGRLLVLENIPYQDNLCGPYEYCLLRPGTLIQRCYSFAVDNLCIVYFASVKDLHKVRHTPNICWHCWLETDGLEAFISVLLAVL